MVGTKKTSGAAMKLDKVLGITSLSGASFASSSRSSDIFYAAGCIVVRYNSEENKQKHFYRVSKAVSCVAVSADGSFLAVGERGHSPSITIWDVVSGEKHAVLTAGHKHGVGCMSFSMDGRYLVSAGFKHDRQLIFWDWRSEAKITTQKLGNKVNAIRFHPDGSFFVTSGDRHLKWWSLVYGEDLYRDDVVSLLGKPASIQEMHKNANFMDIRIDRAGVVYCATATGLLCSFGTDRLMQHWIQLESPVAYSLTLIDHPNCPQSQSQAQSYLIVGCADGLIRVVLPEKLYYLATLPLPFSSLSNDSSDVYAACLALTTVAGTATAPCPKLASIYADHSLFVWDISDIQNVVKYRSFVYHRACVWDVQFISTADSPIFGAGTFATCSADNSIRIWNTDPKAQRLSRWRSVYSREMLHVIEIDDPLATSTVTVTATAAGVIGGAGAEVDVSGAYVRQSSSSTASTIPAGLNTSVASSSAADVAIGSARPPTDICRGIPDTELPDRPQGAAAPRALAVHPAGTQLVCGDRAGLLRVFDLASMAQVVSTHAHSAEVLTLSFSPPMRPTGEGDGSWTIDYDEEDEEEEEDEVVAEGGQSRALRKSTSRGGRGGRNPLVLLASAGRDRLVHILDASNGYRPVTTLDNHSSSVTIVKFTSDGRRLLSCGGDRTMVFNEVSGPAITRLRSVQTPTGTINGLAVEPTNKFAVTSGQDRKLNIWNLLTGKHVRAYKNDAVVGELYKSDVDPSGMFVVTCAFDKTINLFDFFSGELVAQVGGHSELVTAVRFSPDGRYVLSVGGDGCIMRWALAPALVVAMQERLLELFSSAERRQMKVSQSQSQSRSGLPSSRPSEEVSSSNVAAAKIGGAVEVLLPPPPPSTAAAAAAKQTQGRSGAGAGAISPRAAAASAAANIPPPPPPLPQATKGGADAKQYVITGSGSLLTKAVSQSDGTSNSTNATASTSTSASGNSRWASRAKEQGGYRLFGQKISPPEAGNNAARQRHKLTLELSASARPILPPPPPPPQAASNSTAAAPTPNAAIIDDNIQDSAATTPATNSGSGKVDDGHELYPSFSSDDDDLLGDAGGGRGSAGRGGGGGFSSSALARTLEEQDGVNICALSDEEGEAEGVGCVKDKNGWGVNDSNDDRKKKASSIGGEAGDRGEEKKKDDDDDCQEYEDDFDLEAEQEKKQESLGDDDSPSNDTDRDTDRDGERRAKRRADREDALVLEHASSTVDQLERSASHLESWLENMIRNDINLDASADLPSSSSSPRSIEAAAAYASPSTGADADIDADGLSQDNVTVGHSASDRQQLGSSLSSEFFKSLRKSTAVAAAAAAPPQLKGQVIGGVEIQDNPDGLSLPQPPPRTSTSNPVRPSTTTDTESDTQGDSFTNPASVPATTHATSTTTSISTSVSVDARGDAAGGDILSSSRLSTIDSRRRETTAAVAQMKERLRSMGILGSTSIGLGSTGQSGNRIVSGRRLKAERERERDRTGAGGSSAGEGGGASAEKSGDSDIDGDIDSEGSTVVEDVADDEGSGRDEGTGTGGDGSSGGGRAAPSPYDGDDDFEVDLSDDGNDVDSRNRNNSNSNNNNADIGGPLRSPQRSAPSLSTSPGKPPRSPKRSSDHNQHQQRIKATTSPGLGARQHNDRSHDNDTIGGRGIGFAGTNDTHAQTQTQSQTHQSSSASSQQQAEVLLRTKAAHCRDMLRELERVRQATMDSFGELSQLRFSLENSSFGQSLWQQTTTNNSNSNTADETTADNVRTSKTADDDVRTHDIRTSTGSISTSYSESLSQSQDNGDGDANRISQTFIEGDSDDDGALHLTEQSTYRGDGGNSRSQSQSQSSLLNSMAEVDALISEFQSSLQIQPNSLQQIQQSSLRAPVLRGKGRGILDTRRAPRSSFGGDISAISQSIVTLDTEIEDMKEGGEDDNNDNDNDDFEDEYEDEPPTAASPTKYSSKSGPQSTAGAGVTTHTNPNSNINTTKTTASASTEEAELFSILQKYSDRLVDMVSDKVAAKVASTSSGSSGGSGEKGNSSTTYNNP